MCLLHLRQSFDLSGSGANTVQYSVRLCVHAFMRAFVHAGVRGFAVHQCHPFDVVASALPAPVSRMVVG